MDHALPVSAFIDRDDRLPGRHRLHRSEPKVFVLGRRDESAARGVQVAQLRVIDLQLEVFRRLPRERLVVAGGPQMGVRMERFVRSLDPPRNVEFLGEVDDSKLRDLYATCRGLIATSQDEDFGLGPVEAMASGEAGVAVDEGGYRESVVHRKTGWL